jgi:Flp pilus assembly protein TadD
MRQRRVSRRRSPIAPTTPGPGAGLRWCAVGIVLATFLAYANSFSGPFILDDVLSIVENDQIREWSNLGTVLFPERELPTAGRPLVNFSFAVNYALDGLNVRGYHLFSLVFHLASGLLLFGIVRRTLRLSGLKERFGETSLNLGFASAILWTLHPLNTEAVNYLTQRTELMMAFFYLLTAYASIRAVEAKTRSWSALAVMACAAGMACKESMVTAPVMVVLYDAVFVFGSLKGAFRERGRFYGALALSSIVLAAVMWSGPRVHSAGFSSGVDPWTYLLNQTVMITRYLRLTVWPHALVVNYGGPLELMLRDVLPYALLITGLLVLTVVSLVRQPKWGYLGAWFFVTLAPTSSIVPIATEVGAERRMYLPLMALVVLGVVGVSCVTRVVSRRGAAVLAVVATLLLVGTFSRNGEYRSSLGLARTVVERYPSSVAHHFLGAELLASGDREAAMTELRQAIPGAPEARVIFGFELLEEGKTSEGIDQLQTFVRDQPMSLEARPARQRLGAALLAQQRWPEAIEQLQLVLTMNPSNAERLDTHGMLALGYLAAGSFEEAIAHHREYLRARPNDSEMLLGLGIALVENDEREEAISVFRRVAEHDPMNAVAQHSLATLLYEQENFADALAPAEQAVASEPSDPDTHVLLGRVLAQLGRFNESRSFFEQALQIDPAHSEAREDLRRLQTAARQ